ncbi:HNH endonuclease [Burkholderia pseudomallei]|uniref:HNH endonuclease n=1 Tax=Burkholderia pseudomallei TaxID=28450 RepID=UPI000F077EAE
MTDPTEIARRAAEIEAREYREFWTVLIECSDALNTMAPARRRPWLASVVQEMYRLQQGRCALCSEPMLITEVDVDHRIPFCYGGGKERTNLQLAHSSCNRSKRAEVDPHDLLRYLEDRYMNLPPR